MKRGTGRIDEADRRYEVQLLVNSIADRLKKSSTMTDISYNTGLLSLVVTAEQTDDTKLFGLIIKLLEQ